MMTLFTWVRVYSSALRAAGFVSVIVFFAKGESVGSRFDDDTTWRSLAVS
jgi:hypothetical protein